MKDEATGEYQITEGLTPEDYIAIPEEGLSEGRSVSRFDDASFGGGAGPVPDGMEEVPVEDGMEEAPMEDGMEAMTEEGL